MRTDALAPPSGTLQPWPPNPNSAVRFLKARTTTPRATPTRAGVIHAPSPHPTRGEFIRLQLDIKKIEAEGKLPSTVRLHRISSELSAPHSKSWAGVVATVTPRLHEFVAGFVEQVTLTADEFLKHGGAMLAAEPVRHLDISSLGTRAQDFFSSPLLGGIRSLVLDRCAAGNNSEALLAASPYVNQIRWLSLAFNGIDLVGVRSLARSTSLKSLKYANFFGNPCDPAEVHSADQGVILRSTLPARRQAPRKRVWPDTLAAPRRGDLGGQHPQPLLLLVRASAQTSRQSERTAHHGSPSV